MSVEGWFGSYRGAPIGVWGRVPERIGRREQLAAALDQLLGTHSLLMPGGPPNVQRLGIVTGGAGSMIAQARDAGLDTFVTGEGAHHTYFDAMEGGINVIYAGHYATEQVGVQALAQHLSERFGLPWEFHRHPTGL
jgi:putative NIF3 family GTP cyclohydrolase 1 type 2